jgi:hypothetical protein
VTLELELAGFSSSNECSLDRLKRDLTSSSAHSNSSQLFADGSVRRPRLLKLAQFHQGRIKTLQVVLLFSLGEREE